jgi:hypothetical protein
MQTIEKLQSRIDALDFYYSNHFGNCPTVNVKVHGRIKEIDEVADTMKLKEPFKSQAVEIVKLRDREDYGNYFWNVCEREGEYAMDVIFEGVTHNSDEPEQKHIVILKQYKEKSGFFGRSGGHFCIGVTKDDLEQYLLDEEDAPEETDSLQRLSDILDAIEWGLEQVESIAAGVPESIFEAIKYDLQEESDRLEQEWEEKQTPRYKVEKLREWEKTLTSEEREKVKRSIISIEKTLEK